MIHILSQHKKQKLQLVWVRRKDLIIVVIVFIFVLWLYFSWDTLAHWSVFIIFTQWVFWAKRVGGFETTRPPHTVSALYLGLSNSLCRPRSACMRVSLQPAPALGTILSLAPSYAHLQKAINFLVTLVFCKCLYFRHRLCQHISSVHCPKDLGLSSLLFPLWANGKKSM